MNYLKGLHPKGSNELRMRTTKNGLKGQLLRGVALLLLLLGAALPARAADYVFIYDGGYLAVDNSGNVIYTTSFSPQCVWTCVSNTGTLAASTLSNTSRFLYTTDGNGTRRWLVGSTTSGAAITTTTTAPGTAYWQNSNSNLYYRSTYSYYAYYRENTWRTTRRTNGNSYGVNAYYSGNGNGTDYRSTTYQVTTTTVTSTSTNPTINGADVLTATGNSTYTATGAAYRIGYTNYNFNNTNHYIDANGNSFTGTPANATLTNAWSLTDNAYATVNSTSGVVTVTSLPEYDITLTLTVTATATGGTPAAPANTTLTATKEITIQGTKPSAPIISVSGNTATLSTNAAGSTTIRYTLDGTDPTATTGTVYSGAIDLSGSATSPVTIKAVTVRNGNASDVTEQTVTLTLPEPTITINGETGTASITSSVAGATIYYTTDGTTPTTSSSQYTTTLTGLAFMTTVKAIAVKDGWNNSPVASGTVTIPSGVSSSTVTLDDREDHRWTYYSGVDASVDGGNYNTNYVGKLYSPNPRNVKITYNGVNDIANSTTTVKVSVDAGETQNQFVYYKTLEEGTNSGEYPYQVISNPFSVRPSTGTGNSKVYYGFAGWKIVSGGEYIKNHSNGDVLALDEEIVFNNLPYPSVNCTSAEIVFQTTWTQANVQDGTDIATMLSSFSGGTYETNFAVLRATYTTAWTGNKNATITSVMPDGSSDYRGVVTRLNVTLNAGNTIKYEYININNDNNGTTLSMGSGTKTLYIGRGVSNTDATRVVCNTIQGYNDAIGNNGGLTYTLKIESGIYNNLSFIKGYEGNQVDERVQGNVAVKSVLGCDYDRAKGDNTKFKIQSNIAMGYANNNALLRSTTAGQEVLNVTFKSGSLNSNMTNAGTADLSQSFYIGIGGQYSPGYRVFTMEGGEMWNLAAGLCNNTATTNSIRFRIKGGLIKGSIYGSAANANSYGYKQMILTGGQVKGWIAGGGNGTSANGGTTTGSSYLYVGGNCRVDSEGSDTKINSSIGGQVFGSGSGVDGSTTWGEMLYGSNVVIADNAYVERNVFGGGNFGWTDEYATIYLTGDKMSVGKVFGGANQNKGDNVRIYMTGGTVREGLYGGSNTTGTINYNVEMHIDGGQVGVDAEHPANIHGGGYGQPTRVSRNVEITLGTDCNATSGVTVYGDVYGGSALGYVNGTTATTDYHTYVTLNKGTIHGSLYGGGLGAAGTAANVYGPVQVKVFGGSVLKTDANGANGSGAVYGCNNIYGAPQRSVAVDIYGTDPAPSANNYALFAVYGGGNQADYTYGNGYPTVKVHNCNNSIEYIYGGGNAAAVAATDVTIYGGNVIGNVFGGGNGISGTAANVTGNAVTKIYGGTILNVFGGSNKTGTIGGNISITVESQTESGTNPCTGTAFEGCAMNVGSLYGGGNMAAITKNLTTTIGCGAGTINRVYGGSKQAAITGNVTLNIKDGTIDWAFGGSQGIVGTPANITGNVTLNIYGGNVGNAFGGSDINGNITGQINVKVDWYNGGDNCGGTPQLDNVYGGSNLALYAPTNANATSPLVTLTNGCVGIYDFDPADPGDHGRVFGGGKGDVNDINAGKITANPKVLMNPTAGGALGVYDGTTKQGFLVKNALYGGGEVASVVGSTTVQIDKGHVGCDERLLTHDNGFVFGGGKGFVGNYKLANVSKNSTVTMSNGYVHNTLFGGGEMASVGTFTYANQAYVDANPTFVLGEQNDCTDGGTTTVTITGGQVGPKNVTMEADLGYVFGAGQGYYTQPKALGYADPSLSNEAAGLNNARFGYVNNAVVNISDTAFIVGAVWGGSENGQVLNDCRVNISGGQIGCGYNWSTHQGDDPYTKEQWNNAINAVKAGNIANIKTYAAQMRECNHVPYASPYLPYDAYIDEDIAAGTVTLVDASTDNPGDGHTVFGHVFGGGSGYSPYRITVKDSHDEDSTYSHFYDFQGRVRGNTYVTISDSAHVLTSIYGGCEYADVLGTSTVTMTGGTLGVPRTVDSILAHPVTCYLFGGGKGDQRTSFNDRANVGNGVVSISGDAFIFGSVFGGGEDGHVHENTSVSIAGNAWVGNWGTSYYDGNIFGGGRGFGGTTLNAGSISGNATVNIGGTCHILGNIYGGGRLASVGLNIAHEDDPTYGQLLDDDGTHGVVTVNITGGTIGSLLEFAPATFSTETPYAVNDIVSYDNNIWRFKAPHAAGAWNDAHVDEITHTTGGNVFGSSMGRLLKVGESNDQVAANFNHLWPGLAKCLRTSVNISGTARIYGDVYGGGELGYVMKHTSVIIGNTGSPEIGYAIGTLPNRRYTGSVYGGGYGSNNIIQHTNDSASIGHDVTAAMHAGRVYGNTDVQMKGGQVWGNIYGGGEMASVGRRWINIALNGDDNNFIPNSTKDTILYSASGNDYLSYPMDENIGVTNVTVSGGTVGDFTNTTIDIHREPGWIAGKTGGVFGGGKGHPGVQGSDFHYTRMAYVDSANVTMSGGRAVVLFGGGENGHVRYDTKVTMIGGTVGLALVLKEYAMDKYGYCPYPVYQGNVYGGGRGVDRTSDDHLGAAAGQVFRNTYVTISGGTVHHNVYGGGSLATVGTPDGDTLVRGTGTATVTVYGTAVIGNDVSEGRNSGCVYGSGRGMAGAAFAHRAYVQNTYVTIGSDSPGDDICHIYGSVFGGGENGHVNRHTHVYIKPGCRIGELWDEIDRNDAPHEEFVGNVYGGGRGVDLATGQISRTAGWVRGSTHITMTGGHVYHNVYGGGSLANVGDTAALRGFAEYQDTMTVALGGTAYDYARHKHKAYNAEAFDTARANGHVYIWVSGGKIGTNGNANGCVFGGGRGNAGLSNYPFFESSFDPAGFTSADSTFNYTGTPATYTIYFKLEDGKYTTYRKTKLSELGYQENDDIWIIGKKRNTTAERYQDSVTVRDYTNHTYVTGTHVVISYPTIGGDSLTVSSAESDYADSLAQAASNIAGREMVNGSVYGGGDNGHVRGKTDVLIKQGRIGTLTGQRNGNVFGGGSGEGLSYDGNFSEDAGRVYGSTSVTIDGGWILHNVYGGGNMAGVGDFTVDLDQDGNTGNGAESHSKDDWLNGNGTVMGYTVHDGATVVTINGGHIGEKFFDIVQNEKVDGKWVVRSGMDSRSANHGGNVFGSSRGQSISDELVRKMAWVNLATVTVNNTNTPAIMGSVFGGGENGHVFYTATVNINGGTIGVPNQAASGDIFRGNVYGGGRGIDPIDGGTNFSRSSGLILGNTYVNMTSGTVYRNVFGGGSMATVGTYSYVDNNTSLQRIETVQGEEVVVNKDSIIDLQRPETGKTEVHISGGTVGINGINNGRVFGAGRGVAGLQGETMLDEHTYVDRTYVTISANADIKGSVFGSGDNGHVFHNTQVVISGGTIGVGNGPEEGNVFGSGRGADTYLNNGVPTFSPNAGRVHGNTNVYIVGGTIKNNVYGGGFLATVHGNTTITVDDSATVTQEVWEMQLDENDLPTIPALDEEHSHILVNPAQLPTVYGDIFGGSALGVLGTAGNTTVLNIMNGTIGHSDSYKYSTLGCGNIFGGGNGSTEGLLSSMIPSGKRDANVLNTVTVNIGKAAQQSNNALGPQILGYVFGGNNVAGCPMDDVNVNVYSTKHTANTDDFDALLLLNSDTLAALQAAAALIETPATAATGNALFALKAVYGGGNQADYVPNSNKKATVTIFGCVENTIKFVYGGGKAASVNETHVIVKGGHIYQAFAGGDGSAGAPGANIGYRSDGSTQYGAGTTHITIEGGAIYQVFGGSNTLGKIYGASTVELDKAVDCELTMVETFGGNNLAPSEGDRTITIECGTEWNDVYGGNNKAEHITGDITLNILGGKMNRVFGGSKEAGINGNVTVNVTGGSINQLFGGNNEGGNITGTITVNVDCDPGNTCADERYLGTVYGGGKDAAYTPDSPTATPSVNIKCGTVSGDVFGGGLGNTANCTSNPKVLIGGDSGNKTVVVNGNVYGGGSAAPVTGSTTVETRSSNADSRTTTLRNNVYGGGLGATATVSVNTDVKINGNGTLVSGSVYGGGNAGQVNGDTNVEIGKE